MGEYLIQKATLTDIADAIRERAGVAAPIFPAAMPGYIRGIRGAESDTANVPADIVAEAERVAGTMLPKIGANAVTFLAIADMHQPCAGDIADKTILERTQRGNRNAGQGAKLVSDRVALDFFVNLGDLAFGSSTTTIRGGTEAITSALRYTAGVMEANETFCTPGNHDPLTFSYSQNGTYLTPDLMAGLIGTYRFLDLEEKKVRVICLNTADNEGAEVSWSESTERLSAGQLQWFAQSLDLSGKADAGEWKIIILSHHPLDWGNIRAAGNCLGAYLAGVPFSITHDGVVVSYDYTGKNAARVIAQFHGHTHCLKVDYIHDNSSGAPVATSVKRLAIPNAYFYRNNEYATGENYGLVFGEETTCEKSDDSTGKNTAFCLVSIDLDAEVIYADCFGAGYDRVVSFGDEEILTYTITNVLTAAVNSNGAVTVAEGEAYAASITAGEGYELESVAVTMGGEDVTASVYSGGTISIPAVTGDVVITAVARSTMDYGVTNLVLTAQERDSAEIYNGTGYRNGAYASDSSDGTDADCVATGYIPFTWSPEYVIYIRGAAVEEVSHVRFYGYNAKTDATPNESAYCNGTNLGVYFAVEQLDTDYWKLTPLNTVAGVNYIRISLIGTGENLIITVNEPLGEESGGNEEKTGNLVPAAIDTDGSVYNGTGYKLDYRLNSSGTETELAGAVVSGFIPYAGQVLKVSGSAVSEAGTTGNYVALYDTSFTKLYTVAFNSLVEYGAAWTEEDGLYALTVDPAALSHETYREYFAAAAYIRCSLGRIEAATDFSVTLE